MDRRILPVIIISLLTAAGCTAQVQQSPEIAVSILPQKYIVDRITGGKVPVTVMVPPGHNPASYSPTALQIKNLSHCSIYLRIGHIAFEKTQIKRLSSINPSMVITDTSKGVSLISGISDHNHHDRHAASGDGASIDPHIWLSPRAMKIVAKNSLDALTAGKPGQTQKFLINYRSLIRDIDRLDTTITKNLSDVKGTWFIVFHPAWSYFARDYNLVQVPIELEGKEPGPGHIRHIIDTARKQKIRYIFIQKQFPRHWAEAIARDIHGQVIQLDPLEENWLGNMYHIADTVKKAMSN